MKNIKLLLIPIACIGFSLTGCSNNSGGGNVDPVAASWKYEGQYGDSIYVLNAWGFEVVDLQIGKDNCTAFTIENKSGNVYSITSTVNGKENKYTLSNTPFCITPNKNGLSFPTDSPISGGFQHTFNYGEDIFLLNVKGGAECETKATSSEPAFACEIAPGIFKYAYYENSQLTVNIARGFHLEATIATYSTDLYLHQATQGRFYYVANPGDYICVRDSAGYEAYSYTASANLKWGVSEYESRFFEYQFIENGVCRSYIAQDSTFLIEHA